MAQRIFGFIISAVLALCVALPPLQAQTTSSRTSSVRSSSRATKEEKRNEPQAPLYNGLSVGVDVWGIGSKLVGGDNLSMEVAVDANLRNRFFPIVELGYASGTTEGDLGITYKTSAPYFRIGLDYNAFYKKRHGNMLMVGLRYAATSFDYDIESVTVDDPIYGGSIGNPNLVDDVWGGSLPFDHRGMKGSMQWAEICLGLRAHIWQNLYMGWAVRVKYRLSESKGRYGDPWYVPGYGKYGSNTMGVTYTITYKLPF